MNILEHELTKIPHGHISNKLIDRLTDIIHKNPDDKETETALKVLTRLKAKDDRARKRIGKDKDGWYDALFTAPADFITVQVETGAGKILKAYKCDCIWWYKNAPMQCVLGIKKWRYI